MKIIISEIALKYLKKNRYRKNIIYIEAYFKGNRY